MLDPIPGQIEREVLIRCAADVPESDRSSMFWVADLEQAKAWFALHDVHGYGANLLAKADSGEE